MEYQPDAPYQVVINPKQQENPYQQFYITGSRVVGYVYVESVAQPCMCTCRRQSGNTESLQVCRCEA